MIEGDLSGMSKKKLSYLLFVQRSLVFGLSVSGFSLEEISARDFFYRFSHLFHGSDYYLFEWVDHSAWRLAIIN